jgi:hypothetical protein
LDGPTGSFRLEFAPKIFRKRPPIPGSEHLARADYFQSAQRLAGLFPAASARWRRPLLEGAATSGDPELAPFAARMMYSKSGSSPVEEAG